MEKGKATRYLFATSCLIALAIGSTRPQTALAQSQLATIDLTADNEYELFVDGVFVGFDDDWVHGETYSLTLAPGQHVIAVRTLNFEHLFHGGWIADLSLQDGSHVVTDGTWRWTNTPGPDWNLPTADDSAWSFAEVKGPFGMAPWGTSASNLSGTTASWIGTRSDTDEPEGDFYYRRVFTVLEAADCEAGVPIDPDVILCECPEGTIQVGGQSRTDPTFTCEPIMEEPGSGIPGNAAPNDCQPPQSACACEAFSSRIPPPPNLCTCPIGSVFNTFTARCECTLSDGCFTCPAGQTYNSLSDICECGEPYDPEGCNPSATVSDCPDDVDLCPDTYESVFEPFLLYGGLAVHQCGTPDGTFRPQSDGWVATYNTNFTAVQFGSGSSGADYYLSDPIIEDDSYAMLLQRHHGTPPALVNYLLDFASYGYQGDTRSLTIDRPAPEENPPGLAGTTFTSPDGLTPSTIDKEIDLIQADLVSVRYHVSIQDLPYDRISGLRFHASAPGISGQFTSLTRFNGNVPGGLDPATVAGHVYTTNVAHQESVVGELLLPRGHLYTLDEAFVEFMDLAGVRLNEVKIKQPLSVVTDSAGTEDLTRDPESFTLDLRGFEGCQADVYVRISKPAGRIMGQLYLEPAPSMLPPLAGPRVTHYSPSYLGYRLNNTLDGERLGYFVNGAVRWILPVAGSAAYDYKCIAYDRWLPAHRSNSYTALIAWPAGFGSGSGWLRWPVHGETAMNPIDTADVLTTGLDRDGFVYLDGPSTVLRPDGTPYWPNPDPPTTDGPGLLYPPPIGPLQMFTEEIFYDTQMAYLNGHVDLTGCISTENIVSGSTNIAGLSSGPRQNFADERGINRFEVNGAQRGLAHGIFRGALAFRGDYQVVAADGPWNEGNYYLNLRRGSDPDDWTNYYNGSMAINSAPLQTYSLDGHAITTAGTRAWETGIVRIRMRVRNAPFSFDADGNPIANPEFRPFRLPQAFIGTSGQPTWLYTDPSGQTGRYYSSSTGSPTVSTTHYLSIMGVVNSTVNIVLRAQVPENPDGTGRYFTSGFPPLIQVPIHAGEACIDLCTDAAGNPVPCEEGCDATTVCPTPDACHTAWCDEVTRQCTSAAIDCDDGDICTRDACDPAAGCINTPIVDDPACSPVESPCPDGCDDGNPCTSDACELTGCEYTPVADGTSCDDGNVCTQVDSCQSGACTGGELLSCDDGNECTIDRCDPVEGCVAAYSAAGSSCGSSASTACTAPDTCDGAGNCTPNDAPLGTICGDPGGQCVYPDKCDGAGSCTDSGFWHDGKPCTDSNRCTGNDQCQAGVCAGDYDTNNDGICECAADAPGCVAAPDPCPGDPCNLCDEEMNVRPYSRPSSVDLGAQSATMVAVYGSADLDVTALDLGSLSFDVRDPSNVAEIRAVGSGRLQVSYSDLNGDGIIDVSINFVTDGMAMACIGQGILTGSVNGCSAPLNARHDLASDPIMVINAQQVCE